MRRGLLVLLAGVTLGLAACGGGGGGGGASGGAPAGSTKVTMTDYKFNPADINVKAGKANFFLVNSGGVSHDLVVMSADGSKTLGRSELVQPGNSGVLTIDNLPAGNYSVICDQPGHANLGMKATLTAT
jgi:uncharacterized cupredoxin-like copper-binding protein